MADPPSDLDQAATVALAMAAAQSDGSSPFAKLEPETNGIHPAQADEIAAPASPGRLDLVFDVPVCLSVELGRTEIPIRDVVNLGRGSIIELDRGPGAPLDVRVNGVLVGRGEIVLVNAEKLGLRFVEVVGQADSPKRPS
jgi:flagellar motor switch protein FliN/FliY